MAYPYRGPQSPRDDPAYPTYPSNPISPQRNPNSLSGAMMDSNDSRAGLTRRFTTNALPTLSPIGQQRRQAAGEAQMQNSTYGRIAPSEQKSRYYEQLLQEQRRIQALVEQVDPETRREVDQNIRHEIAVTQMIAQSEPTTPPEYEHAFPSAFSRPNRYSSSSLTSPPGIINRPNRSSTQLTSPPGNFARPYTSGATSTIPSQSVPGSRRQSDDEQDDDGFHEYDISLHRAAANPNRNSMPITSHDRRRNIAPDLSNLLGPVNTTSFLFGDENKPTATSKITKPSPPDGKTFLQVQHTADGFPKLIRRDENGVTSLTDSSFALDLALSQLSDSEKQLADRPAASRHRISLPPSALRNNDVNIAGINGILINANDSKAPANNRRSMEVKFAAETKRPALMASPPHGLANGMPQSSYSTNDIPTLKSINGDGSGGVALNYPTGQPSELASSTSSELSSTALSRVDPNSTNNNINCQSQEFSAVGKADEETHNFGANSGLQANAPPFGPISTQDNNHPRAFNPPGMAPYGQPAFYGGYGMQMLGNGFNNMNLGGYGGQGQWSAPTGMYQQNGYSAYQQYPQGQAMAGAGRFNGDNQRNVMQQRRAQNEEATAKFNSVKVEDIVGEIYGLCKDQHGCRFLQRKLDERNERSVQVIFDEVMPHIIELMTDPFGNYLCQKLLENANDEQRTALIKNAMPAMTNIALNQHGTRALQKMIEFITLRDQTELIIEALRFDVVQLIQDLNGNHVIQKCLNHLSSPDAQFIFDAVGMHCIAVGTHRHGCCVLQRCIDHASGLQKGELVRQITNNAYHLVQDPFGNYVVQYILDLAEPAFTEPLCHSFAGHIVFLSKQKFSSNVIEKCIRCAGEETKRMLIQEIAPQHELEKLLRDSFANYVVQTAMDFADEEAKALLVENLRPILPSIRNTPYGRRIQTKMQEYDGRNSDLPSGVMTPVEPTTSPGAAAPFGAFNTPTGRGNRMGFIGSPPVWNGPGGAGGDAGFGLSGHTAPGAGAYGVNGEIAQPSPRRNSGTYNMLNGGQNYQNHGFGGPAFNRVGGGGRQAPAGYGNHF